MKEGSVEFDNKMNLTGGFITIDMTTIGNTDLSGKYKKKLLDHLNSDDFFDVANNKEAHFKITKVEALKNSFYSVTGTLTIRGQNHEEKFKIKVEKKEIKTISSQNLKEDKSKEKRREVMIATGELKFNRTKYGVSYNSESSVLKKTVSIPKDKIIKDHIQLTLHLQTQEIQGE